MVEEDAVTNGHSSWALTNGRGYILNRKRNHAAAGRLNLQFYLWKDTLGYNIHPRIAATLAPTAILADVAAGSGIWLIDVARSYPHAQLYGLDLDLRQAPHASLLPARVRMRQFDLRDDVPADLVGRFDYIHTRLLVLVVEHGDPSAVLRKLRKLLRPGGWLQWDELDAARAHVTKAEPHVPTPSLDELRDWSFADGRHSWTTRLADVMTQEGFHAVKTDFVDDPPELARAFTDQHLLTAEEFAEGLTALGKTDAAARYLQLIETGYEESVAAGAALCVPRLVCTAQKPEQERAR